MKSTMNPEVDVYLSKAKKWQPEMKKLRSIILNCQLTEELKWAKPVYTFQKRRDNHCPKRTLRAGVLQRSPGKDAKGFLTKIGQNSQAGRWIKFSSVQQIVEMEPVPQAYIQEAIAAEKAGLAFLIKKPPTTRFLKNSKTNYKNSLPSKLPLKH